ncbi:MAG: ATP-dependent Clp protease proteolytic subunit [Gemmatales bacterium]|nr:ATP-dependent Clp protease proteolytic subunit [Gemmatales bacterium]MDW8174702.1 ATP-dependent Clp protease proteolytic subunit [Gemmatales bacterium]
MRRTRKKERTDVTLIGDVEDWEADVVNFLLDLPPGGECTMYMDSPGGSVYGALAVLSLLKLRQIRGTIVVLGECSSACLLIFGGCTKRLVTPHSVFFFHRMRWQSDRRIMADEARQWAQHFVRMEEDMDGLLVRLFEPHHEQVREWVRNGQFLFGRELARVGLAELVELP